MKIKNGAGKGSVFVYGVAVAVGVAGVFVIVGVPDVLVAVAPDTLITTVRLVPKNAPWPFIILQVPVRLPVFVGTVRLIEISTCSPGATDFVKAVVVLLMASPNPNPIL